MTLYANSTVQRSDNTGTITIRMGDAITTPALNYTVDVVVSIESANYNYTGGNPGADFTFGNNGARWSAIKFSSRETKTLVYNWSTSQGNARAYVVVLSGTVSARKSRVKTPVLHVHYGSIPGPRSLIAQSSRLEEMEMLVSLKRELEKLKAPPPKPPIG